MLFLQIEQLTETYGFRGSALLAAALGKAEIPAEERHHMVLEAIGYGADMRTRIDLETVCDSVFIEDFVQLRGIEPKAILIAHVHGDGAVLLEIADVLFDKGQTDRCKLRIPKSKRSIYAPESLLSKRLLPLVTTATLQTVADPTKRNQTTI